MTTIVIHPRFARRLPDPFYNSTHGTDRHVFFVPVSDIPAGISLDPSPRAQKTRWDVYKEVQASLLDQDCTPGTFHLKNRGITIIARAVSKIDDDEYQIELGDEHGIIDGSHTYRLILEAQNNPAVEVPKKQFVKIEVLTKVPEEWIAEISSGLNTSILGQEDSLVHLQDALQWIRDELTGQKYYKAIAWTENERGEYDVRDILAMMACFDIVSYPNTGSNHPVVAYDNKSVVLGTFEEDYKKQQGKAFRKLRPILKDIFTLYDTIQLEFPKILEQSSAQAPELVERATKKPFKFPFLQTHSTERLARGALFPIVAAFRWMVEDDPANNSVRWRGGFDNVIARWHNAGEKLVAQTVEKSAEVSRNPDAIGRSASHWGALHKEVAFLDLMAAPEPPKPRETAESESAGTAA